MLMTFCKYPHNLGNLKYLLKVSSEIVKIMQIKNDANMNIEDSVSGKYKLLSLENRFFK